MSMRAFRIAYDGSDYYGFQRQPDVPTVEDALFDALRALDVLESDANKPEGYAAAGRTDAGVSALAQTVAFEAPEWLTPRAFNAELPADVRAWAAADAEPAFHATHHATRREYVYHLYAPPAECARSTTRGVVDDSRFHAACDALSGSHDFRNLTCDDHNTEREPALEASRNGDYLVLTVSAPGFARELVRRLVSLARDVATGDRSFDDLERALEPSPLPGHEGVPPAPPEALVLADVRYPALAFVVDERAAASARAVFDARYVEHRTGARIAGQLRDGLK
jgi:tRNA pseudouridine38-40 synthase